MALTCDDPQPESGKCLHTQESGDAGFSTDMKHIVSDDYQEAPGCLQPVINKGSSVRPVNDEVEEISLLARQEGLKPSSFESEAIVSAGEEATHLRNRNQLSHDLEDELEEKSDPSFPRQKAQKRIQKKQSGVPGRKRTTDNYSAKMRKKYFIVCCYIFASGLVGISEASAGTCFTCMDKARCPNLITIYAENDDLLYERNAAEIPECSETTPVTSTGKCFVCSSQSVVKIYCLNNIETIEPEDDNGSAIRNFIKGCDQQQKSDPVARGEANKASYTCSLTGLICGVVAVVMVMGL